MSMVVHKRKLNEKLMKTILCKWEYIGKKISKKFSEVIKLWKK